MLRPTYYNGKKWNITLKLRQHFKSIKLIEPTWTIFVYPSIVLVNHAPRQRREESKIASTVLNNIRLQLLIKAPIKVSLYNPWRKSLFLIKLFHFCILCCNLFVRFNLYHINIVYVVQLQIRGPVKETLLSFWF